MSGSGVPVLVGQGYKGRVAASVVALFEDASIKEKGYVTATRVAKHAGVSVPTAKKYLREMERDGLLIAREGVHNKRFVMDCFLIPTGVDAIERIVEHCQLGLQWRLF